MAKRLGLVIDLDRCTGCGACQAACRLENNIPPSGAAPDLARQPPGARAQTASTPFPPVRPDPATDWLMLLRAGNALAFPHGDAACVPVMCQHCEQPPCVRVCPVGATGKSPDGGVVYQVYARCIGCRACLAACPYGARVFTWTEPAWPGDLGRALTPFTGPRVKGVAEKCDLCAHRGRGGEAPWKPACAEACPARAMTFGDLDDPESPAARLAASPEAFRLTAPLLRGAAPGPRFPVPQVVYVSRRAWLRWQAAGDAT